MDDDVPLVTDVYAIKGDSESFVDHLVAVENVVVTTPYDASGNFWVQERGVGGILRDLCGTPNPNSNTMTYLSVAQSPSSGMCLRNLMER